MIIARRFSCYTIFSTLTSSTGAATFPLYCFIDPISQHCSPDGGQD